MEKLSPLQRISACVIATNFFAINLFVIITSLIQENSAYWVVDNILYTANVSKDGRILNENATRVNVFDLSEKEVKNLLSIIDNINS